MSINLFPGKRGESSSTIKEVSMKAFYRIPVHVSLILMVGCILLPGLSSAERTEEIVDTIVLNRDGEVIVKNISGNIIVTTWPQSEVKMIATKRARTDKDLENVYVHIQRSDTTLRIETRFRQKSKNTDGSIEYNLTIPDLASLTIESINGDVSVKDLGGEAEFETISGDVSLENANKGLDCSVISGDMTIKNISGNVSISAISGDISITEMDGQLSLSTVSGDIVLEKLALNEKLKVSSVSGDITISGDIHPAGYYKLDTHSGTIKLIIPERTAFSIDGSTFSGSIKSDFALDIDGKQNRKVSGRVGEGGADLKLSTFSGSIIISQLKDTTVE